MLTGIWKHLTYRYRNLSGVVEIDEFAVFPLPYLR